MNSLRRTLLVAMATIGLMVGAPSLALGTAPAPQAADGGNYLDALAIAMANIEAALKNATPPQTKLQPDVAQELSAKLHEVESEIGKSRKAFGEMYKSRHPKIADPAKDIPVTLEEQLHRAMDELQSGSSIIQALGKEENAKKPLRPVKDALQAATTKLIEAQELLPTRVSVENPPELSTQKHQQDGPPEDQAKPGQEPRDVQLVKKKEAAWYSEWWQRGLSALAILLAVIAIALVFLPVGPIKKLRSRNEALADEVKKLTSRRADIVAEIEALKKEVGDLTRTAGKASVSARPAVSPRREVWVEEERRGDEGMKQPQSAVGFGARETAAPATETDASPTANAMIAAAPEKTVQVPREPVADYNDVRAMKAAGRSAEFSRLYPKQMMMTCANPSARNSGPFTELRFKEDHYGKFQAVEHGKDALLFPELNYDYSTGRKTLEGVFQYPEVESATFKLAQAAALEKRGDEWALIRQGVLQNG